MIFFKTCSREWRYPDQAGEGEDAAEAGAEGPHRQGGAVCQAQGRLCSDLRLYITLMNIQRPFTVSYYINTKYTN